MGPDRVRLKNHTDVAFVRWQRQLLAADRNRLIPEVNRTCIRDFQASHHSQCGGFTTTTRSQERNDLAIAYV
jgi:hypothetical protein